MKYKLNKSFRKFLSWTFYVLGLLLFSPVAGAASSTPSGKESGWLNRLFGSWLEEPKSTATYWYFFFLLVLFIGFFLGYRIGFVYQAVFSMSALVLPVLINYMKEPVVKLLTMMGFEKTEVIVGAIAFLIILLMWFSIMQFINNVVKLLLRLLFLRPLDGFLGATVGLTEACVLLGCIIALLENTTLIVSEDVMFVKEIKFVTEKICGTEFIKSLKNWNPQSSFF